MTVAEVAAPLKAPQSRGGFLSPRTRRTLSLLGVVLSRELKLIRLLFASELRELLVSRALWAMVLISGPLVGFSFIQAVRRYSETSSNALRLPQLAANLSPLDGIVLPTLGAVYLMNTFLLPFVAIRLLGNGKQTGALKLALQLPLGPGQLVAIKLAALGVGWFIALIPTLSAFAVWGLLLGGHLFLPELITAILGHLLYAFVIAGVAFLAASVTESPATAAIVALSFTLGSWILEFAGSTTTGLVRAIAAFSLSPALRGLERGLLGSPTALTLIVLGLMFLALTVVWLPPGISRRQKLLRAGAVVGVGAQMLLLVIQLPLYFDVSEDRRNSFNPADERALRTMTRELKISVNLASNDSRLADLDRNVLSKLPRIMPRVSITYPESSSTALFGGTSGANYGQVTYTYAGKQGTSRATTARELLPLIEALGGLNSVTADKTAAYPGFPLVTSAESSSTWFYVLLPVLAVFGWWFNQRAPLVPGSSRTRPVRWPWLQPYLPLARRAALAGGAALVVLQLVPYGRDHVNIGVSAPPPAAAATCQTIFPAGTESPMKLSDFRGRLASMMTNLNGALFALALNDPATMRGQYAQFATTYRSVALELAELYPGRCPRLNGDALAADAALAAGADTATTSQWLNALNVGLFSVAQDLDIRIRQEGPDELVGLLDPETDQPTITGMPAWNSESTQLLATRACAACHSNQPNLPWYTNVAPLSWLVQYQVDTGRRAFNVSEWDRPQLAAAAQAAASVQRGNMPPGWMAAVDPKLQLSDAERAELTRGLLATLNGVRP